MIEQIKSSFEEQIQNLPSSLQHIARSLEKDADLKPSNVIRVIKEAQVHPEDLKPWSDFDHPEQDSYGRKMVFKGDNFEIMVMSWRPGDFSGIHDHGYTQWGAVQIFGPAEHATFRVEDGHISTLARWTVKPGDIVGVGHSLVHQMGNTTTDTFFLSLHVYGELEAIDNVTGDARIFDLENNTIQRVDGGVFFALPPKDIKRIEKGPKGDFPTRLRHMVELSRRLRKMEKLGINESGKDLQAVIHDTFSSSHLPRFLRCLDANTDDNDHQNNSIYWRALNREIQEAAKLQNDLKGTQRAADKFHKYATMYDALIGKPCMEGFIKNYLLFFKEKYKIDFSGKSLISLGSGTGLVEKFMINELAIDYNNLYGIDISEAMVQESQKYIRADVGDILTLNPSIRMWDFAFSGLNVFHYLDFTRLEESIQKTAAIINEGGYFIGDFITPDHIRWYPNVMYSEDQKVVSLRTPELIEENGRLFQESEIINIDFREEQMDINYAGKHRRFLPPMNRIRSYFEKAFKGQVDLYDAHSLELIPDWADSCKSTRYVVVARKGGI
ncbi:MAG: hypothetical protein R2879_17955 [Saprospiraceae bacterium]